MNIGIFVLALATFVAGTVELVIAGIINMIAEDLHVSVGAVGQLVSVFSLVFAFGAPVLIALTSKVEKRKLLLIAMLTFLGGNILSIVSPNFTTLLIARIILAASCSIVVVTSVTMAAKTVATELRGRAIGLIFMGLSASLVLGVPLGTIIGQNFGWRMTFVLVAVLSIVSMLGIIKFLPKVPPQPAIPLRKQIATLKSKKIASIQLISVLELTGHFIVYTYFTLFLKTTMDLSTNMISMVLLVFGIAGITGGWIGGWASDKFGGAKTILTFLILFAVSLFLLPYATGSMISLLIVVVLYGAMVWALSPAVQNYLAESAPDSSDIQLGLNTSFLHLGVALGSGFGGLLVDYYSVTINTWVAGIMVVLALISAIYSLTINRRGNSSIQGL
ncbi:MFS transporter [Lysinibacillus agricola]|uniref:MFS transporter n=1 Tax=Lysinibacillus agricola TaxID=2590012 RepID=A0ABX7ATQ6_9BACI|nr:MULTISPECIES: MFS transporter [Lysinibacillus]KOS60638.1 MFS transporter [Lysinibacillus sp. FJAT-14222]QQP13350.1 MFS transporter [Lysinibacillus agricola]